MSEERETVELTGTKEKPVKSEDILEAIEDGKNIKVRGAVIEGDLFIKIK